MNYHKCIACRRGRNKRFANTLIGMMRLQKSWYMKVGLRSSTTNKLQACLKGIKLWRMGKERWQGIQPTNTPVWRRAEHRQLIWTIKFELGSGFFIGRPVCRRELRLYSNSVVLPLVAAPLSFPSFFRPPSWIEPLHKIRQRMMTREFKGGLGPQVNWERKEKRITARCMRLKSVAVAPAARPNKVPERGVWLWWWWWLFGGHIERRFWEGWCMESVRPDGLSCQRVVKGSSVPSCVAKEGDEKYPLRVIGDAVLALVIVSPARYFFDIERGAYIVIVVLRECGGG